MKANIFKTMFMVVALSTSAILVAQSTQATFNTKWDTEKLDNFTNGTSNDDQITIKSGPNSNFIISWGDGSSEIFIGEQTKVHTYATKGEKDIVISGTAIQLENNGDIAFKLLEVSQWGAIEWLSMRELFAGSKELSITATDTPVFSANGVSCESTFLNCESFNSPIGHWDMSHVTSTKGMFAGAFIFNQTLNSWDVSNVTDMSKMFDNAKAFNQPLDNWDVSNVTNMESMFLHSGFNQPIDNWDVSNVTSMESMFLLAIFNQPLNNWNISNVTNLSTMFTNSKFNQPLNNWDLSQVTTTYGMFSLAKDFDQDISNWDVRALTDADLMFDNSGFSIENYDLLLDSWSKQQLKNNVNFTARKIEYCSKASERQAIISNFNWTIVDGGQATGPNCTTLSVSEEFNSDVEFIFSPNPTSDYVTLEREMKYISVYGLEGKKVLQSFNAKTIDFTSLSTGTYLVRLEDENQNIFIGKIIKL